ncbi:MAG TPA: nucleoside-diphosphate kinase [Candidatus Eisenbacteria bacterium]|jgi:nucleoside-diphosphate kinase|nr:nucleoside-diphosphate kinase [Candidatus Eisenbacteria bacterium]
MAVEETLFMIKPDAVAARKVGLILAEIEKAGFEVLGMKMVRLTPEDARRFYAVHEGKPFLEELVQFMSSGPAVPCRLRRDDAILFLRERIGATDPKEAKPGTIRALYAESKGKNAVHASDSPESARTEIPFFF